MSDKKKLIFEEVLFLEQRLPIGMKELKQRLVNMDIARQLMLIRHEKNAFELALESKKPEGLDDLQKKHDELFYAEIEKLHPKKDKKQLKKVVDTEDEANEEEEFDAQQLIQKAQDIVRVKWEKWLEFIQLKESYIREQKALLRSESDYSPLKCIEVGALPETLTFEAAEVLAYFSL